MPNQQTATPAQPADRLARLWAFHQADSGNVNLLRDIAREALGIRAYADALKALDALRALGETQANDEAAAVHALIKLGRFDDACARAEQARQTWPDDESVRLENVRALFNARRHEEAFDLAQSAPFTEPALAQMGGELTLHALWHLGRLEDAADLGQQLARQWPDNPAILALYSAVLYDEERMAEAFDLARRAYQLSAPHAYLALQVLASERLMKNDVPGALRLVEQAQQVRQDDGRIWLIKGSAHLAAGQVDEAIPELRKALEYYPNHPGTHLTLAWVFISRQQFDDAEAAIRDAIAASPAFAESHGSLAVVYVLRGQPDEARQSIRRASLLDKESFSARYAQSLLDGAPAGQIDQLFNDVMLRSGSTLRRR